MNCPKCGKILEPGAVICPNCGETVVENIAEDNGSSLKRSIVSEDVLRNFSEPEHISDEDNHVSFSDSFSETDTDSSDDENQYFNPDDYKNDDDYQSSFSAFDDDMEDDEDKSEDSDERDNLYEDDYSPRAVEDYDVFSDDDDDEDDDEDDEDDEDYDSAVIVDNNYQDNDTGAKRTRIVLIAVLILAMLVVICGVVYLVFGEKLMAGLSTDESSTPAAFETGESQSSEEFMFKIPDLKGMKYSDAVTRAREYGLETKIVYEKSETVEKGLVIGQSPSAGTTGKVGDTITITVSLGKDGEAVSDTTEAATEETQNTTENTTSTPTTEPTEAPTQKPTQPPIEKPTEKPTEPPTEKPTDPSSPGNNYYILPDSATRLLTLDDISGLSMAELELARNEIYARHGRRFTTDYIQEYFNSQQWYSGTIDPDDFDYGVLSDIEVANVWFIYDYEHSN